MSQVAELDDLIAMPRDRAAALAGVSRRRVIYWEMRNLVRPAIRRRISVRGQVQLYTFRDLVCLLVVAELRKRDFSLQHVRRVVDHLRSQGYQTPLGTVEFATLGRSEIYFKHADESWEGDGRPNQLVIHQVISLEPIRQLIRSAAGRPSTGHGRTERRRGVRANQATFTGTRVPVSTVVAWLESGHTASDVIEAYPDLTDEDVQFAMAQIKGA